MAFMTFHKLGTIINPFDFHIFQRGRSTTNQLFLLDIPKYVVHIWGWMDGWWWYRWRQTDSQMHNDWQRVHGQREATAEALFSLHLEAFRNDHRLPTATIYHWRQLSLQGSKRPSHAHDRRSMAPASLSTFWEATRSSSSTTRTWWSTPASQNVPSGKLTDIAMQNHYFHG